MYFCFLSSCTISCLQLSVYILPASYYTSLPPANEVCEGDVFTRVCHFVHKAGSAQVHAEMHTHPPGPEADTPWDQRQTPPGTRGRPPWDQRQAPPGTRGRHHPPPTRYQRQAPPRTRGRHPPGPVRAGKYGQQAGGTHPTGMYSCFLFMVLILGTKVLYQSHINGEFHQLVWDWYHHACNGRI